MLLLGSLYKLGMSHGFADGIITGNSLDASTHGCHKIKQKRPVIVKRNAPLLGIVKGYTESKSIWHDKQADITLQTSCMLQMCVFSIHTRYDACSKFG